MKSSAVLNNRQERTVGSTSHFGSSKEVSGNSSIMVGENLLEPLLDMIPSARNNPVTERSICLAIDLADHDVTTFLGSPDQNASMLSIS